MDFSVVLLDNQWYNSDDEEDVLREALKNVPSKPGVFYLRGKYDNIPNSILYVGITNNLFKDIGRTCIYKGYVEDITFKVTKNREEQKKNFIELFERFKPKENYIDKIMKYYQALEIEKNEKEWNWQNFEEFMSKLLGDLSKFDRDISEDVSFKRLSIEEINEFVHEKSGIYFIYNENCELMYIGKADNLKKRLPYYVYKNKKFKNIIHNFKLFKCIYIEEEKTNDYETFFINKYKPLLNEKKTYTYLHSRYSIKYNVEVQKCGSVEEYLKLKFAMEEADKYKCKVLGYFDNKKNKLIVGYGRNYIAAIHDLLDKAELPFVFLINQFYRYGVFDNDFKLILERKEFWGGNTTCAYMFTKDKKKFKKMTILNG